MSSQSPFVRIEEKNELRIIYFREDGSSTIYIGGTRNWRNNNPGNIGYGNGNLVKKFGAIGKAGGFAVFPDYETGRKAIFRVLKKDDFQVVQYQKQSKYGPRKNTAIIQNYTKSRYNYGLKLI